MKRLPVFILFALFMGTQAPAQPDTLKGKQVTRQYKMFVFCDEKSKANLFGRKKILIGFPYQLTDSGVYILNGYKAVTGSEKGEWVKTFIRAEDIDRVEFRKSKPSGKAVFMGAVTGTVAGVVIGSKFFRNKDCPGCSSGAGQALAMVFGSYAGGTLGAAFAHNKRTVVVLIKNDKQLFLKVLPRLNRYFPSTP